MKPVVVVSVAAVRHLIEQLELLKTRPLCELEGEIQNVAALPRQWLQAQISSV